jgi:S-adenosylmethionine-diacylglycerol 3-amino-3-carboxypropyl transferase
MTGNFTPEALPPYLRREHEDAIRAGLDRLRLVAGPVERVTGRFAGFNLSDIFEYMSDAAAHRVYADLLERATPGARLVYWNLLAPRRRPEALAGRVREREDLARDLHVRDRAWFYRWLRVDELAGTGSAAGAAGARA